MYILIAAATAAEIDRLANMLRAGNWTSKGHDFHIVYTGIGGTATTYALLKEVYRKRPDLMIQAGIAGSFQEQLPPGSMAIVKEEVFADLGAVEKGNLVNIFDLGLADPDKPPFTRGFLLNPAARELEKYGLPLVRSATVNAISSSAEATMAIRDKYAPALESMEGAAFHYVGLMENIPFLQLRAVSNYAGERNKANWKIKESIETLNEKLAAIIAAWV